MVDAPVVITVFQRVGGSGRIVVEGRVAIADIILLGVQVRAVSRRGHGFKRFVRVDGRAFHQRIGHHAYGVITCHAPALVTLQAPHRQHSHRILAPVGQHRPHHVGIAACLEQAQERMLGAVGIPKRKDGIVRKAFGLMHFPVHAAVAAVHVHIDGRIDHRVVQRRIEAGLLVGRAFALHHAEFPFPCLRGLLTDFFERLSGSFRCQVLQRALRRNGRQRHFHLQHGIVAGKLKKGRYVSPGDVREVVMQVELAPEPTVGRLLPVGIAVIGDGLGKRDGEIGLIEAGPAVRNPESRHEGVVDNPQARPENFAIVVVDAVEQVHHEALRAAFRIRVLVHAHPLCGGKPGADAAVSQSHFIIARFRVLGVVAEPLPVAAVRIFPRTGIQLQGPGLGYHQDVAQVGMPRSAEMRVAETHDGRVVVLVAGATGIDFRLVFSKDIMRDRVGVG